jgi:hypothetical protein
VKIAVKAAYWSWAAFMASDEFNVVVCRSKWHPEKIMTEKQW